MRHFVPNCLFLFIIIAISSCKKSQGDPDNTINFYGKKDPVHHVENCYSLSISVQDNLKPIEGASILVSNRSNKNFNNRKAVTNNCGIAIFDSIPMGGVILTIEKEGYRTVTGIIDSKLEGTCEYNDKVHSDRNESIIISLYKRGFTIKNKVAGTIVNQVDDVNSPFIVSNGITYTQLNTNKIGNDSQVSLVRANMDKLSISDAKQLSNVKGEKGLDVMKECKNGNKIKSVWEDARQEIKLCSFSSEKSEHKIEIANFSPVPRPLFLIDELGVDKIIEPCTKTYKQIGNSMRYVFKTGTNYKSTPILKVNDPTGRGFSAKVYMKIAIQRLSLLSEGQYLPNENINFYIMVNRRNEYCPEIINSSYLIADNNGKITNKQFKKKVNYLMENYREGWGNQYKPISFEFDSVYIEFDESRTHYGKTAVAQIEEYKSEINYLKVLNFGTNYTDPTITFEGGKPEKNAAIEIIYFGTKWAFTLNTEMKNASYSIQPYIKFGYFEGNGYYFESSKIILWPSGQENDINEIHNTFTGMSSKTLVTSFYSNDKPIPIIWYKNEKGVVTNDNYSQENQPKDVVVIDKIFN